MSAKGSHKHIVRFDYGRSHGWFLRIELDGKRWTVRKFFSDGVYGGSGKALRAALMFRDAKLRGAPSLKRKRNGAPWCGRIYFRTEFYKEPSGRYRGYPACVVWFKSAGGKVQTTRYSYARGRRTKREALALASAWLEQRKAAVQQSQGDDQ